MNREQIREQIREEIAELNDTLSAIRRRIKTRAVLIVHVVRALLSKPPE